MHEGNEDKARWPSIDVHRAHRASIDQRTTPGLLGRRAWLWCAVGLLLPTPALADSRSRKIVRYDRPIRGSSVRAGAARGAVAAAVEEVRQVVTDYSSYASFIKQFERARVIGRAGAATDLYFEIPILHGLTKIWAVVRFQPPVHRAGATLIRGVMVKGNVKRLDVTWQVQELDKGWTELTAELLVDLKLPAPRASVLKTVKRAAAQAVKGARQEAERRSSTHAT